MSRPKRDQVHYSTEAIGTLALVAWGRLTAAEAAEPLRMHRSTVARAAQALFGRDPHHARKAYARRLIASAEGIGKRPLTKHQMREAQAKRETPSNPA